jgi:hypothetical protein
MRELPAYPWNLAGNMAVTSATATFPVNRPKWTEVYLVSGMRPDARVNEDHRRIVKDATQAREGVTGHNVRYVLIFSLIGICVVFAGLWLYYFG